jgi:hypothetical protein
VIGIPADRTGHYCLPTTFKPRAQDSVGKLPVAWFASIAA